MASPWRIVLRAAPPRLGLGRPAPGRLMQASRYATTTATAPATAPAPAPRAGTPARIEVDGKTFPTDSWYNAPAHVLAAAARKLHLQADHPVCITRQIIERVFPRAAFPTHNTLHPVVSVAENFDSLGFPPDHPGRARSDTYYLNASTLLRTHTSAHEAALFRANESAGYLLSADVYRRDEVDRRHYPVFHQMEGARRWDRARVPGADVAAAVWADVAQLPAHALAVEDPHPPFDAQRNPRQTAHHSAAEAEALAAHLKRSLELVVVEIFTRVQAAAAAAAAAGADAHRAAAPLRVRWVEAYFPFTSPSWELEVLYGGAWLEVLGCGITQQSMYINAGQPQQLGWAFGIGLDRIAMLLFHIPDIRLFWSQDERFLGQFAGVSADLAKLKRFVPFSKHPECYKDVSFWLPPPPTTPTSAAAGAGAAAAAAAAAGPSNDAQEPSTVPHDAFHANDVMEVIRSVAGDTVEDVKLVDEFTHPKTGRRSMCYRINYRSLERTLTNAETNRMHADVERTLAEKLGVTIR